MDDRRAPHTPPDTDDVTALEAVWGREASANAPGAPRPDIDAIFDPAPERPAGAPAPTRTRRTPLVAGIALALAVVVAVAAALVVLGGDDEPEDADRSTTIPAAADAGGRTPTWTASIACRPRPDVGNAPICPVAVDDERAYVLVDRDGTATVEARGLGDGAVAWEVAFPEGAAHLRRLPAALLVLGVGPDWETVGVDPATGTELWRAPGTLVGPVGPDHVLLDDLVGKEVEERGAMAVVETATGRATVAREGTPAGLYIHPCGDAGLALVRQDGRLTAVGLADGGERWSAPVEEPLDAFHRVHCDHRSVAYVAAGTLHLLDAASGLEIGTTTVAPADSEDGVTVLAVVAGTVVVGSSEGARGFRADADLEQLWRLRCRLCGPRFPVGPAGDGVVVVIEGEAIVRSGADGRSGPRLDLEGRPDPLLEDGTLLAWGRAGVVLADTADLGDQLHIDVTDVRQAAAGPTHLVATTVDEVRAYPREG